MSFYRLMLLGCIITISSSCSISEELQYKGYNNFKVSATGNKPEINVDVKLYNPNPIGAKLKNFDIELVVEDQRIGSACLDEPVKMKAREEFILPIIMQTSLDQLAGLTKPGLESLLFNKPLAVEITGNVTVRKFIFKKSFDFNYTDSLNVSDLRFD